MLSVVAETGKLLAAGCHGRASRPRRCICTHPRGPRCLAGHRCSCSRCCYSRALISRAWRLARFTDPLQTAALCGCRERRAGRNQVASHGHGAPPGHVAVSALLCLRVCSSVCQRARVSGSGVQRSHCSKLR